MKRRAINPNYARRGLVTPALALSVVLLSAVLGCGISGTTFPRDPGATPNNDGNNTFNNDDVDNNDTTNNDTANNDDNNNANNGGNNGGTNNGNNGTNNGDLISCEALCGALECASDDTFRIDGLSCVEACQMHGDDLDQELARCVIDNAVDAQSGTNNTSGGTCDDVLACFGTTPCRQECEIEAACVGYDLISTQLCLAACELPEENTEPTCLQQAWQSGECAEAFVCLGLETCVDWCEDFESACGASDYAFEDLSGCVATCGGWYEGVEDAGDTLACHRARLEEVDAEGNGCADASAVSVACVGPPAECVEYCDLMETMCGELVVSPEACLDECVMQPIGEPGSTDDDLYCRLESARQIGLGGSATCADASWTDSTCGGE